MLFRSLLGMPKRKLEIICYHAQQCAEKSLKSIVASSGGAVPRTHDLRVLSSTAFEFGVSLRSLESELALLQPYSVAVRYPHGLDLVPGDETVAISAAKAVLDFCATNTTTPR